MNTSPDVTASLVLPDLAVFVVAEPASRERPANGGLRVLPYADDSAALADGRVLAARMTLKHALYGTGFAGGKIVARAADPRACKDGLLGATRALLEALAGRMYTGCDLNVSAADMQQLSAACPYVLAAVDHPVDASTATAQGVLGAFDACVARLPGGPVERVLVHGIGAVGRVVAERLVAAGLDVRTADRDPARTVPGARPAAHDPWSEGYDAVLLCSATGLVTKDVAARLDARLVVSGANAPFANAAAEARVRATAHVLPDALANAGAVIVDSVEHYAPDAWAHATPESIYAFTRDAVRDKVAEYLALERVCGAESALASLCHDPSAPPVGARYLAPRPTRGAA